MSPSLISSLATTGLFALSAGAGVAAYVAVQPHRPAPQPGARPSPAPLPARLPAPLAFDAEPALLARADEPVDLDGDAFGVLYLLERDGDLVRRAPGASGRPHVHARLADGATESGVGFSAIALHPDFRDERLPGYGRFYVIAAEQAGSGEPDFVPESRGSDEHHQDVLYEYTLEQPFVPDFEATRREVIRFSQPGAAHNVESLAFDPRGHLYLAVGDGADAPAGHDAPSRNASSLTCAFGKVLRIDPLARDARNGRYGIPDSNPFRLLTDALPELWAAGLRSPHSLHFDPFRDGLCIGESASGGRGEIHLSFLGGEHYGWDLEASSTHLDVADRRQLDEIVTAPVLAFERSGGADGPAHGTGNVVYRGERFPSLVGKLVFAGRNGRLVACDPPDGANARPAAGGIRALEVNGLGQKRLRALRTTPVGELVVFCEDGSVLEIRKSRSVGSGSDRPGPLFCTIAPPRAP